MPRQPNSNCANIDGVSSFDGCGNGAGPAGKPYVSPAGRMSEISEERSGASMRSSKTSTGSGKSTRIGLSPHDRSLRAPAASKAACRPQTRGMPFRAGGVPVRVDRHGPGAVGLHRTPLDRVERGGRQREHMLFLRFEQAGDGHAEPVMVGLREPFARVEPRASPTPGTPPPTGPAPLGCGARTRPRSPRCLSRCPSTGCRTSPRTRTARRTAGTSRS